MSYSILQKSTDDRERDCYFPLCEWFEGARENRIRFFPSYEKAVNWMNAYVHTLSAGDYHIINVLKPDAHIDIESQPRHTIEFKQGAKT